MREHLGAGHSPAYFQYDVAMCDSLNEPMNENRRVIIETLRGMAVVVLDERTEADDQWGLRFGLGWTTAGGVELELSCEGCERSERPAIDFTLKIDLSRGDIRQAVESLPDLCYRHGVSWRLSDKAAKRISIELRQRIFSASCNPDTVKHVLGNYRSCWDQLEGRIIHALPQPCGQPVDSRMLGTKAKLDAELPCGHWEQMPPGFQRELDPSQKGGT